MLTTAIKLADADWSLWLEELSRQEDIDGFECDAGLFLNPDFRDAVQRYGLNCHHLRELLPSDATAAFLTADDNNALPEFYSKIFKVMRSAYQNAQTTVFSLPLRLDRLDEVPNGLNAITVFLEQLLKATIPPKYTILIPVRIPRPFPESLEEERALQLCGALQDFQAPGSLKLALHLYPEENILPKEADATLRPVLPFLHTICFHYFIPAQETLFDDEQATWAEWLRNADFHGQVIFCPDSCPAPQLPEILRHARHWAREYR